MITPPSPRISKVLIPLGLLIFILLSQPASGQDTTPPQLVAATGSAGGTTITFWFNELVDGVSATNTSNLSLSGGLTVQSISGIGTDSWTTLASMPAPRGQAAVAAIDGKLYVAGGEDGTYCYRSLYVYDPTTDSWTALASMPTCHSCATAVAIDGKLYVAGGWDGSGYSSTLVVYDPTTDNWTALASMPTTRGHATAAAIDGKMYVACGWDGSSYLSTLEVYNPATDSWTTKASMPTARSRAAAAAIDGKLYVAGGYNSSSGYLSTLEVYDPATDSWTTKTSMPTARYDVAEAAIDGKMYVACGWNGSSYLSTLEVYDPATDSWTTKASMPTARSRAAAAAIDGKLYVAGGYNSSSGYLSTLEVYTAVPSRFELILADGQLLPSGEMPVTLTATNIADLYGNTAATLNTTFYPTTGEVPTISIGATNETCVGDITFAFYISDTENNPVSLTAEYSTDGSLWSSASVTGPTSDIAYTSYHDTLTWHSQTDLPNQLLDKVWFKVTPRDNALTVGVADSTSFGLDNKAPEWIAASGVVSDTTITFWFNELVDAASATSTASFSLSGGLTVQSISGIGTDSWTTAASMSVERSSAAAAAIDGNLYVAGGHSYSGYLSTLAVYDPATDSWTTAAAMPTARWGAAGDAIDGKLYVAGGKNGSSFFSTLEVYDPATGSWTTAASMPTARDNAAAAAIAGKLYVAGGYSGSSFLSTLEVYNPATGSWTTAAAMPTARYGAAAAAIDGKLYVAGGYNGSSYLSTLEVYDPATGSWTTAASMPTARYGAAGDAIDGKLYVAGGHSGSSFFSTLEVYDPATGSWTTAAAMPTARYSAAGAAIDGKLYVAGGCYGSYPSTLEVYTAVPSRFELTLTDGQTLPFERITLEANNIQDLFENTAGILSTEFIPDDGNTNPMIILTAITDEVSGDVSIEYTITDPEGDLCTISPVYLIQDGIGLHGATTSSDTTEIGPSAYTGSLLWNSFSDLPHYDGEVHFAVSVNDNDVETPDTDLVIFHLDNNFSPVAVITNAVYSPTDTTFSIHFTLHDEESDTLSWACEYSIDDGGTWLSATTIGDSVGILSTAYTDSLIWEVVRDLPGVTREALFRIIPCDKDPGTPAEYLIVIADVPGVPTVSIVSEHSEEQTGDITFEYVADDRDSDPITLQFEYEHPAGTWNTATVTGSSTLSEPSQYAGNVIWHSGTDLDGHDLPAARFRIRPSDPSNDGFFGETTFHLDNNDMPVVSIEGSVPAINARDIVIDIELTDAENDTLSLKGVYSTDHGVIWNEATLLGNTDLILPGQYPTSVTWRSFDDIWYSHYDSVLVRLYAADHDSALPGNSPYFEAVNYVGDYSGDVRVDFSDFAVLVTAWNTQDIYHDIGPATGNVPGLIPDKDGMIDFNDLTTYLRMWTWSVAQSGGSAETAAVSELSRILPGIESGANEIKSQQPVVLNQLEPEDLWATDSGLLTLNLDIQKVNGLTSAGIILHYDVEHLEFMDIRPGIFLGSAEGENQTLITVKRIDEKSGRIEIMYGRINAAHPEVKGSGTLAVLQFVKLSRENSVVSIQYDLRNRQSEILSSGSYQAWVAAASIPGEFALLQNYPNPFNGETIIRFQLPTTEHVQMYIYNIRGQRVATLVDARMDPGYHRINWDGRSNDGSQVASGIYIYLIQAGRHRQSRKLIIIR